MNDTCFFSNLTLQDRHCSPNIDRTLTAELTEGTFKEEKGKTSHQKHCEVWDEKGPYMTMAQNKKNDSIINNKTEKEPWWIG